MLATPWCTDVVETTFEDGKDERIPKFYCPLHNNNIIEYPIPPDANPPKEGETDPPNSESDPKEESTE